MKRQSWIIALVCLASLPVWTEEDVKPNKELPDQLRLIPPIQVSDDWTLANWGWSKVDFRQPDSQSGEFRFYQFRLNSKLQGPRLAFGLVLELADLQSDTSGNWLREAWVETLIGFDGQLKLRGGYNLLACGRGNPIAGLFKWPTPDYPNCIPFSSYGLGLQLRYESKEWTAIWDVTGKTGVAFDSSELFDYLESSAMVKRQFEQGGIGLTGQINEDFLHGGVFAEWNPKPCFIRAEIDGSSYTDDHASNQAGGYLLAGVQPFDWLRLSLIGMANRQLPKYWTAMVSTKDKTGSITWSEVKKHSTDAIDETVGITGEISGKRQLWSVRAGYYWPLERTPEGKPKDGESVLEGQVRF